MAGFGCLILFIHFTVSSVVRSYLQSQLKKCLQFNSILGLAMPQIELLLLFWALGKWGRSVSAEPQDRMALLQEWGGQPREECNPAGSLIYGLCKSKATKVMDFRIYSFEQQFQQLATLYERVEGKKQRNVFGRKSCGLTLSCKQLIRLIPSHGRYKIRQKSICWAAYSFGICTWTK